MSRGETPIPHSWQNSDFGKRIEITVPSPDADLLAHPFPVILDGLGITDTDIVEGEWCFYDSADNLIPWERETYAEAGGTCTGVIWTKLDQYSAPSGEQNHLWFYYKKLSGSTPGNTATDVWDSHFIAVHHMSEASGTLYDSTTTGNNVAVSGSPTYGQAGAVGKCLNWASNGYGTLGTKIEFADDTKYTIQAWIKPTALEFNGWIGDIYAVPGASRFVYYGATTWLFNHSNVGVGIVAYPTLNVWTLEAVTCDGTNSSNIRFYRGGSPLGSAQTLADTTHKIRQIATYGDNNNRWPSPLDEFRISNIDRAAAWLKQDYTVVVPGLSYGSIESPAAAGAHPHLVNAGLVNRPCLVNGGLVLP